MRAVASLKKPHENYKAYYKSCAGVIEIITTENETLSIDFTGRKNIKNFKMNPYLKKCLKEIDGYFKGKLKVFSMRLRLCGTDFQKKVWKELMKIPFGKTVSYKDIAKAIGAEKAVRAVGGANRANKISIVIPCHRVIGSNGKLVGYAGGLWRKKLLLEHEKKSSIH